MNSKDTEHQDNVVRGMLAALGAFFMFSLMSVLAKLLSENHSVIEIGFYRNLVATLPFLIMIFIFGRREILVIKRDVSQRVRWLGSIVATPPCSLNCSATRVGSTSPQKSDPARAARQSRRWPFVRDLDARASDSTFRRTPPHALRRADP